MKDLWKVNGHVKVAACFQDAQAMALAKPPIPGVDHLSPMEKTVQYTDELMLGAGIPRRKETVSISDKPRCSIPLVRFGTCKN